MKKAIIEFSGWAGISAVTSAYFLISLNFISANNLLYLLLNFFGSIGIIINSYEKHDYQPVVLNVIWVLIAIIGMIKYFIF